jgi:hypothetical protein
MALAKNIRTGKVTSVPDHYIGHPVLGKDLQPVGAEVQAAPKKENKFAKADKPFSFKPADKVKEEQPAPDNIEENEE